MNKSIEMRLPHVLVGGMPVAVASDKELTSAMLEDVQRRRAGSLHRAVTVFSSNAHAISAYASDESYAKVINSADIIHADGQIIVWASRMSYGDSGIPERTATTDFIHSAAKVAVDNGLSFYLLGSTEEINRDCAERMTEMYPGLKIAGRRNGYFDPSEEDEVVADINASGADILWVGLGKPKEQFFAARIAPKLKHCAWVVTCGGCYHYIVGDYARAPMWMQKLGLEWVHRVSTGPTYLLKRYAKTVPHALSLVLRKDVSKRFGRK
ncbi:WecB/TagA/CpsF family glycosyltransferase [Ruegeria sp. R14_0]|uniref:WecB/TagA/CpsF family glycosyltransferase n=1 Tax=Ruegeria sp. R14_0 TaxID=2821100 RepID=UPI001ADBE887|nr:WecB/TagA/CpsF family glycosyltransferase [Ruegeria sp. R14_0]MBO9445916.1 WecB/TagA/CpsF family glycosyltransferase [Ruegeria sp. R14_0]